MKKFMSDLRERIVVGVVGGSDLVKQRLVEPVKFAVLSNFASVAL